MNCKNSRVFRNKETLEPERVIAPNGEDSILYKDILSKVQDMSKEMYQELKKTFVPWFNDGTLKTTSVKEVALGVYKRIYSPKFVKLFKSNLDVNGEPIFDSSLFNKNNINETIKKPSVSLENGLLKDIKATPNKWYTNATRSRIFQDLGKWNVRNNANFSIPEKSWEQMGQSDNYRFQEKDIQGGFKNGEQQTLFAQADDNSVQYTLKALDILNSPKSQDVWNKGIKAKWSLDKILSELQIPKDQKEIILDWAKENNSTSINDIITGVLADLSYSIEINTATENEGRPDSDTNINMYAELGIDIDQEFEVATERDRIYNEIEPVQKPTQYYSNLTVPGGVAYAENEIAIPNITPSIKGHAQFSTDNGIGWFRSDEQVIKGKYKETDNSVFDPVSETYQEDIKKETIGGNKTKNRRILELQSDLFQKGRDKKNLDLDKQMLSMYKEGLNEGHFDKKEYDKLLNSKENQFLQLLNKDGNWIPFFIKSIVQDSIKKGYENVLFPTGDTASKIEGHSTLEEFKKEKEERINNLITNNTKFLKDANTIVNKSLVSYTGYAKYRIERIVEKDILNGYAGGGDYYKEFIQNEQEAKKEEKEYKIQYIDLVEKRIKSNENEIKTIQEELKRVETEGFGALKPIYEFYENRVKNSLDKIYGKENVKRITDEYGNQWYSLDLTNEKIKNQRILLSKQSSPITNEVFDKLKENIFQGKKEISTIDVLKNLSNSKSPYIKKLASLLSRYTHNNVPIHLMSLEEAKQYIIDNKINLYEGKSPEQIAGFYNPKKNEIIIVDRPNRAIEAVIEHEIIHALTYHFLHSDDVFAKEFNKLYNESKTLFTKEEQEHYGFTNVDEFLTNVLTNSDFQKLLASKPSPYKSYKNKWEEIKSVLKSLLTKYLGLSFDEYTLFDHVFDKGLDIIEASAEESELKMSPYAFEDYVLTAFTTEERDPIIQNISKYAKEIEETLPEDKIVKRTLWAYKQLSGEIGGNEKDLNQYTKSRDFKEIRTLFTDPETGIDVHSELVRTLKTAKDDDSIIRKARAIAEMASFIPALSKLILKRIKEINETIPAAEQNMNTWFNYIKILNQYKNSLEWIRHLGNEGEMTNKVVEGLSTIEVAKEKAFDSQRKLLIPFLKESIGVGGERRIAFIDSQIEKENIALEKAKKNGNERIAKASQERINELEKEKRKYNFNSDAIIDAWLSGEYGDISGIAKAMDSYRDSTDPLIGAFVNATNRKKEEVHKYITHQRTLKEKELAPHYKVLGYAIADYSRLGKAITFLDKRLDKDGKAHMVLSLLAPYKNYQYDRDLFERDIYTLQQLKARGEKYNKEEIPAKELSKIEELEQKIKDGVDKIANEEKLEKLLHPYLIQTRLDSKYLEYALWQSKYMNRDKTDAYYETYDKLYNDEIGIKLKQRRKEVTDKLNFYKSGIDKGTLDETDKENIKDLWRQYYSTGNLYTLDGDVKTGEELEIAKRAQLISRANGEHYEYKMNIKAFERDKKDASERYIVQYGEDSEEYQSKMKEWEKDNTRTSIKQEYYDERQKIITELNDLLKFLPNSEARDLNIGKLYEEMIGQVYGLRDDDGQPIGGDVNEAKTKKIKELQEKIEEIKDKFALFSGLNDIESAKFSELFEKKSKGLSTGEWNEFESLKQQREDSKIPRAISDKIISLFEQIKNLSSRIPTNYYVEAFNNISPLKIEEDGKFEDEDILTSPKLEELLQNEQFSKWFHKNHYKAKKYNPVTKEKEEVWNRLYQWSKVVPTNPDMMETIPSKAYSYRILKEAYRTDKIVGVNVDNKNKYLPRLDAKDDKYINQEFFKLENSTDAKDQALYNVLEIEKKYHLQNQELASSNYDKLWMDVPRTYKSSYERNTSAIKSPIGAIKEFPGRIKAKFEAASSFASGTGNAEDEEELESFKEEDKYNIEHGKRTRIPVAFLEDIPAEEVSLNIRENMLLYGASLKTAQELAPTLAYGEALRDIFEKTPINKTRKISNFYRKTNERQSSLEYFLNRDYFASGKALELNLAADKILMGLKGIAVQEFLGANIGSIITNLNDGVLSNIIHAGNGRYRRVDLLNSAPLMSRILANNMNDYARAEQGEYSTDTQLKESFEPVSELHILEGLTKGKSNTKWLLSLDPILGLKGKTEDIIQTQIYAVYLYSTKVDFNGQTISLADAYEKDVNGIIKLKDGIDKEWEVFTGKKWFQLKQDIGKTVRDFQGGYAKMDKTFMDQYTSWSFFVTLKRFFFKKFMNEFGASSVKFSLHSGIEAIPRYNPQSGADLGFAPSALNGISRALFRNFDINVMTKQEKADFLRLCVQLGSIYILGWYVKYLLGGSDDEKKQNRAINGMTDTEAYLCYQLLRLQNETETLISPSQYHGFIFSFTAATVAGDYAKVFNDIRDLSEDEFINSKASKHKKDSKKFIKDLEKVVGLSNIVKPVTQPKKQLKGYIKAIDHPWQGQH